METEPDVIPFAVVFPNIVVPDESDSVDTPAAIIRSAVVCPRLAAPDDIDNVETPDAVVAPNIVVPDDNDSVEIAVFTVNVPNPAVPVESVLNDERIRVGFQIEFV